MNRSSRKFTPKEVERAIAEFKEEEANDRKSSTSPTSLGAQDQTAEGRNTSPKIETRSKAEQQSRSERIRQFASHFNGILSHQNIADLKSLPARKIFELMELNPIYKHAAVHNLNYFPSLEAIALLSELVKDPNYKSVESTILWVLETFTTNPDCSQLAIKTLKELNDPRAIHKYEKGTVEAATIEQAEELMTIAPSSINFSYLSEKIMKGSVFFIRDAEDKVVTFAIAIKFPEQYLLFLHYIHTDPAHRQLGYAEDMIKYLIKNHVIFACELLKGSMLSEKVLKKLGFTRVEGMGEKWVFSLKS